VPTARRLGSTLLTVTTWGEFAAARPDLAEAGRDLLYQFGVGLAFLATVRSDGGPRVHPICPLLTDVGIYAFVIPSPKQGDLRRDRRYSLHSFPRPDDEDALYLTGRATLIDYGQLRSSLSDQFVSERTLFAVPPPAAADALFEFDIERCLLTRTTGHGDPNPKHVVWSGRLNA
jgi:hypothetical protein